MKAAEPAKFDDPLPLEPTDADAKQLLMLRNASEDLPIDPLDEEILKGVSLIQFETSASGLDGEAALQLVADRTLALMEASGVAIGLLSGDEVVCRARAGTAPEIGTRLERDQGLSGECLRTGKIVRCADTNEDPRVDAEACRQLNLRSAAVLPICSGENVVGVLDVFSAAPHAFDNRALLALSKIAQVIAKIASTPAEETLDNLLEAAPAAVAPMAAVPLPQPVPLRTKKPVPLRTKKKSAAPKYILVALVLLVVVAYFALAYRPKEAAPPTVPQSNTDIPEKSAPTEPSPQSVTPIPQAGSTTPDASPTPEAAGPTPETEKRPPATVGRVAARPRVESKAEEPKPAVEARQLPIAQPKKLRQPDPPLQPPPLTLAQPAAASALSNVVQAPVTHPKLAPPPPPAPKLQPKQQTGKSNPFSRVLGGATKPVKVLLKKDRKDRKPEDERPAGAPPLPR